MGRNPGCSAGIATGMMHCALLAAALLSVVSRGTAGEGSRPFRLGLNADNWSGQAASPRFRESVRAMGVEFIVWHVNPMEIAGGAVQKVVAFCREENLGYLFNTEVVNYLPRDAAFLAENGAFYRWDLKEKFLDGLKDDPLFMGVVYDEPLLVQNLLGTRVGNRLVEPYFADTRKMTPERAFDAVAAKINSLSAYYRKYNCRMVLETLFPDSAFVGARGGAVLAVKLLKENYNDLIAMTARGAARQYLSANMENGRGTELWACVDLWYLDTFPQGRLFGLGKDGGHTPEELRQALQYAYETGFDAAYIEMAKGLMNPSWKLTAHGRAVAEFDQWRKAQPPRTTDWRTPPPAAYVVRRFPSGNPGGKLPAFLDMRSYGSGNYRFQNCRPGGREGYCRMDSDWWEWFVEHADGVGKTGMEDFPGTTFNTVPYRSRLQAFDATTLGRSYKPLAGLPEIDFVDHTFPPLPGDRKNQVDFYADAP
ncbi:MAG: hypothetical protein LBE84_06440 [Planctomycetota bacterium]|jgi:hypothetical protein|nr:hypothetical protein [Planctomycetota bacterium]